VAGAVKHDPRRRHRGVVDADLVGHMSSVAQRVLERLDAELSHTDDAGRPRQLGKVAVVTVVGNDDGAHKVVADLFQAQRTSASASRAGLHVLKR
jgi:hypothetical protein